MSTVRLGPRSPSTYESRLATMLSDWPVALCSVTAACSLRCRSAYSCQMVPMNTPVREPFKLAADTPASSSASQHTSSISRCCGSISAASRGEMPKKSGSNPLTPSRKYPCRTLIFPGAWGSASYQALMSQRSAGTSRSRSFRSHSSFQNASASGAPGKRHASPTTAMGSDSRPPCPARLSPTSSCSALSAEREPSPGWISLSVMVMPSCVRQRSTAHLASVNQPNCQ